MANGEPDKVRVGGGLLYVAPLGTTEPTDLTTAWATVDADWVPVGYTDEGHELSVEPSTEDITVDEELDPIRIVKTGRTISVSFSSAEIDTDTLSLAFNGGTVVTGTGIVTFSPPDVDDADVKVMLGWQSFAGDERWVYRQCVNTGPVTISRRKGEKALLPMEFRCEKPESLPPFSAILATS